MKPKILLIANPKAGVKRGKKPWESLCSELSRGGASVDLHLTRFYRDAYEVAFHEGSKYEILVACGGDGTFSEVAGGISQLQNKPKLGFLPIGSTCDIAKTFNLPQDPKKASEIILYGFPFAVDIGICSGSSPEVAEDLQNNSAVKSSADLPSHFVYVAAFGAFTDASYKTPRQLKKVFGHFAYMLGGAKSLKNLKGYDVKITIDGRERRERLLMGMVANTTSIGKIISLDNVKLDDGKMNIILVQDAPFSDKATMLKNLFCNQRNKNVTELTGSEVSFEFSEPVAFTLDGEYGGERQKWEFRVKSNAIVLMVGTLPHKPSPGTYLCRSNDKN